MTKPLKLIRVGNSTGVIIPKDVLTRLRVDQGDELYLTEQPDGKFALSGYDASFAEAMEKAEAIMREDRDILRVLAK